MDHPVVSAVREFVDAEVRPVAAALEHEDTYPHELVARMRELGLFGSLVPAEYGGLGLDVTTYARVIEELCRGWMSLAGVINSHTMAALIVLNHGTEAQRQRFLPRFAGGQARGGLALTEPHAGTDVQAIRTVATRRGDDYLVTGTKLFITNAREGNTLALLALTDPKAEPRHRGMSCFIVEKGHPGFRVVKSIAKLGYKGVDTAELHFEDCVVPAANLVGGIEGRGFKHVMGGLEAGRINIAARAVGVAQAAYDDTLAHLGGRGEPAPALADMATRVRAARLLTSWAAAMKDRGERCDLEAGMAKLFASESAQEVAVEALRLHGGAGALAALNVERYYRDTPLMIIGEGTNEIQRTIIARGLLERYGERFGALTSRESESADVRQMVLAVRQLVDKLVVPAAQDLDIARAHPASLVAALADLGILGALVDPRYGGLGLDTRTAAMIVEEIARGSAALAAIALAHFSVTRAIEDAGTAEQRERLLPAMTRGETVGAVALDTGVRAVPVGDDWILDGQTPPIDHAGHAELVLVEATSPGGAVWLFVIPGMPGVRVSAPVATLGLRGLAACRIELQGCRVPSRNLIESGRGDRTRAAVLALARLGVAAIGVGLSQAAFEAALRYSQQRTTFGKPIAQHQAIQLMLADMATKITAARLLTYTAAASDTDPTSRLVAKVYASEIACEVTLNAMRVHGGYGYTSEFPVERYYRDAARLSATPTTNAADRDEIARLLSAGTLPGGRRGADR
jgi:alkylation response protein AidB-like acyl-CoA dehydrogenase